MNTKNLEIVTSKCRNPAQFLSGEPLEHLEHDCVELIALQTKVREDLEDRLGYMGRLYSQMDPLGR